MMTMVFLIALVSLGSTVYCWNDIQRGHPRILSLRQITLIMDREALNRLFGKPDANFRYTLSPEMLAALLRSRSWYVYSEMAADMLCLYGASRYLNGVAPPSLAATFVLLAVLCQAVNIVYSLWLVHKWGWQIREEMGE
jgi:hypothetical protein